MFGIQILVPNKNDFLDGSRIKQVTLTVQPIQFANERIVLFFYFNDDEKFFYPKNFPFPLVSLSTVLTRYLAMAKKRQRQSFGKGRKWDVKQNRIEAELNADTAPEKTLVDVNNDCLERVFEFLDFRDLIYLAEANKHLGVAAETVFIRKLKRRMIVVKIKNPSVRRHKIDIRSDLDVYDDVIRIRSPLLAIQTIRRFGPSIPEIRLKSDESSFFREKFFVHINKYCYKTLNTLIINGDYSNMFGAMENLFENVEKFTYHEGTIGRGCEQFNRIFPHLHHLKVIDSVISDWNYILYNFPKLDAFTFNYDLNFPTNFTDNYLKTIITLNPQLESFELISYYEPSIWRFVNAKLKNLKSIYVSYSPPHAKNYTGGSIQFNTVETFDVLSEVGTDTHSIDVFSFKCLKKMTVRCWSDQVEVWLDFVLAHPTIEVLEIIILDNMFSELLREFKVRQQLNKVRQNTRFISIQLDAGAFLLHSFGPLPNFFEANGLNGFFEWFDKLSIEFDEYVFKMEEFFGLKSISTQINNYKMTKNILMKNRRVDLEKCECVVLNIFEFKL